MHRTDGAAAVSKILVSEDNTVYSSENGVLYNKSKTVLLQIPSRYAGYLTLPESVSIISEDAVAFCSELTGITIPDTVTEIGAYAFYECDLKSVILPNQLTGIREGTFARSSITKILIPDSVVTIGISAFDGCSDLKEVTISNGVISIEFGAFWNCSSLTSITIPDSVTSIGDEAFLGCKSLTHVAYGGTQAQWSAVTVCDGNTELTSASKFHYETVFETVDTCVETGVYCPVCQAYITRTVWTENNPNPNPNPVHVFANATCTTPKTCVGCSVTDGDALGHSGGIWFELLEPTCVVDGIKARICSACNETEVQPVAASGHIDTSVVTAPTCTEKGYTTNTCSVCGNVAVTDYVEAIGHRMTSVVTAPTCTEQGYTTNTCSVCSIVVVTDYVDAKGHGWSAWVQIKASTCTTAGASVRFCNCGVRDNQTIQKLPHSYENEVCTGCGEIAQYNLVLTANTVVNRTLTQDLYVDLNGFDLSGTIITNGYKVYGMDSTTDRYTCDSIGYFSCVDENGSFIVPERIYTEGEKQYMAICTEDRYSFHRFFVGVTYMSLEPEAVGLGYKAAAYGDEMVFTQLAATKAFSFRVQLEGYNPVYRYFDNDELTSGESIALRIRNYDVENYSEHNLYAQVSLTLNDGTVIEAEQVSLTFRWLTEQVNANYTDYTADQLAAFRALLQEFTVVKKWDIPNLI